MEVRDRRSDPRSLREIANSDPVQRAARGLADAIQRDARNLAPRRTGNLRRNIKVEPITDLRTGLEGYAVGWDDRAYYGPFVERGQGKGRRQPRPHLVPAAVKNGAGAR